MATQFQSTSLTKLREMENQAADIFLQFNVERARIMAAPRVRPGASSNELAKANEARIAEVQTARNLALKALDDKRQEMDKLQKTALGEVTRAILGSSTLDPLTAEIRSMRVWHRIENALKNLSEGALMEHVGSIVDEALTAGDNLTLGLLHEDMPAYLMARGFGSHVKEQVFRLIDERIAATRPSAALAIEARREIDKGVIFLSQAIAYFRQAIMQEEFTVTVPTWKGGSRKVQPAGGVSV